VDVFSRTVKSPLRKSPCSWWPLAMITQFSFRRLRMVMGDLNGRAVLAVNCT